ncbi:MAG: hypothetical protein ACFBZ8_08725 [Opitutales bacterium]
MSLSLPRVLTTILLLALPLQGQVSLPAPESEHTHPIENWHELTEPLPARTNVNAAKVVQNYLKVLGGGRPLAELRTRRLEYRLARGGTERIIREIARADGAFLRVEVRKLLGEDFSDVIGFDGHSAWSLLLSETEPSFRFISGQHRHFMLQGRSFPDPLHHWAAAGSVLDFKGEAEWGGRAVYRVRVHHPTGLTETLDFDRKTFLLTRRLYWRAVGDLLVPCELRIVKYTRIEGFWLPSRWEYHLSGHLAESATLLRASVNERIAPELFQPVATRDGWAEVAQRLERTFTPRP